jgi:hypothetical protein
VPFVCSELHVQQVTDLFVDSIKRCFSVVESLRCRLSVPNFMCNKSPSSSLIQSSVVSLPSNFLGKSSWIRSGALCQVRTSFASHRGLRRIAQALFVWSELLRRFTQALFVRPEVHHDLRCGFAKQQSSALSSLSSASLSIDSPIGSSRVLCRFTNEPFVEFLDSTSRLSQSLSRPLSIRQAVCRATSIQKFVATFLVTSTILQPAVRRREVRQVLRRVRSRFA